MARGWWSAFESSSYCSQELVVNCAHILYPDEKRDLVPWDCSGCLWKDDATRICGDEEELKVSLILVQVAF